MSIGEWLVPRIPSFIVGLVIGVTLALLLGGCASYSTYYHNGAPYMFVRDGMHVVYSGDEQLREGVLYVIDSIDAEGASVREAYESDTGPFYSADDIPVSIFAAIEKAKAATQPE